MIKKIIISPINNIAAIVHYNKIQEIIVLHNTYQVNDIYLGTIQKIFTSINAAFVKLNYYEKSGFIHLNDIKNHDRLQDKYNISDILTVHQKILVQIIKEPTTSKGPRLTTNIHLTGKHLVLMPFNNTICITNRIYDKNERSFLRALGILIKPTKMGILFKESSLGVNEKILLEDIKNLNKQWSYIQKAALRNQCPSPIYKDDNLVKIIVRDYYNKDIKAIIIDSNNALKYLCEQIDIHQHYSKKLKNSIKLYQSKLCILEKFSINRTILNALCPRVELNSGVYLFIESSEALTVIDVNSGSFNQSGYAKNTLLRANCLAASEIAYQLRIRNINGIIIIDFIDMKAYKDKLKLLEHFNQVLKIDNAKPEIIQLSELGLVELTRRRRGKSLLEIFTPQKKANHIKNIVDTQFIHNDNYKSLNTNSIFFKKKFLRKLNLNRVNSTALKINDYSINLLPLEHSYIIPLNLYYSIMGKSK